MSELVAEVTRAAINPEDDVQHDHQEQSDLDLHDCCDDPNHHHAEVNIDNLEDIVSHEGHFPGDGCSDHSPEVARDMIDRDGCVSGTCGHKEHTHVHTDIDHDHAHHKDEHPHSANQKAEHAVSHAHTHEGHVPGSGCCEMTPKDAEKYIARESHMYDQAKPEHPTEKADHHHEHVVASHSHNIETDALPRHEVEQIILRQVTNDIAEVSRQSPLPDVEAQIMRNRTEELRIASETETTPFIETTKPAEITAILGQQVEQTKPDEVEHVMSNEIDAIVEETVAYKSAVEPAVLETEIISSVEIGPGQDQANVRAENSEPVEVVAMEQSTIQLSEVSSENEQVLERSAAEVVTLAEAIPASTEVFENLAIELATLPVFEVEALDDALATQPNMTTESTPMSQTREDEPIQIMRTSVAEVATAIVERYDDIEERLVSTAPQQLQEIQKALTNIRAAFRQSQEQAIIPESMQRQLIRLLQLLGFEDPSRALAAYIHQYGVNFADALVIRLFELLNQGQYFESLPMSLPQTADDQSTTLATRLGAAVVRLVVGLRERLPLSAASATME